MRAPLLLAALAILPACGARTPLNEPPDPEASAGGAGGIPADAAKDTAVAPPSCDKAPLEKVVSVSVVDDAPPRTQGEAFYDESRDRVVVFGGLAGSGSYNANPVAVTFDPPMVSELSWVGGAPKGWTGAGTGYDPNLARAFIVGGTVGGDFSARVLEASPSGEGAMLARGLPDLPVRARGPAAGFDWVAGRLVVFGGYDGVNGATHHDETWELRPDDAKPAWKLLADAGGPPAQEHAVMTFAPTVGLLMIASTAWDTGSAALWVMRPGTESWESIPLSHPWPSGNKSSLFWDEASCRLIYWGGACTSGAWSIQVLGSPGKVAAVASGLPTFTPRVFMNAALDPVRRRVVVHGGYDCGVYQFLDTVDVIALQ